MARNPWLLALRLILINAQWQVTLVFLHYRGILLNSKSGSFLAAPSQPLVATATLVRLISDGPVFLFYSLGLTILFCLVARRCCMTRRTYGRRRRLRRRNPNTMPFSCQRMISQLVPGLAAFCAILVSYTNQVSKGTLLRSTCSTWRDDDNNRATQQGSTLDSAFILGRPIFCMVPNTALTAG